MQRSSREHILDKIWYIEWTPETVKETRKNLGLTQYDVAEALCVTQPTIAHLERGDSASWHLIQLYGIFLERYWAYNNGFIPAYRKVGENIYLNPVEDGGEVAVKRPDSASIKIER